MPNTPTPTARLADDAPMLGGQSPITGREPELSGARDFMPMPPPRNELIEQAQRDFQWMVTTWGLRIPVDPAYWTTPYSGGINT